MFYQSCNKQRESALIKGARLVSQNQNWLPIRFIKFGLVGGSGFVIDTIVYFAAQGLGAHHSAARVISYWCAATNNWFLNRIFTFNDVSHEQTFQQWLKYMAMCCVSFVLNWGCYYLLTTNIPFFIENKYIAFLLGIALGMVANFTISHLVIFREKAEVQCK